MDKQITIQAVKGGYILTSDLDDQSASTTRGYQQEVFTSQGKLLKAVRTLLDDGTKSDKDGKAPMHVAGD